MSHLYAQRGMTLMELLQTVGIVGIVLSFGVPSMTSMMRGGQVSDYVNELVSTVHSARSQAVSNVVQVTVCKSADQVSCSDDASWDDGWIAFADADEDEIRDLGETPEPIVHAHAALDPSFTLQSDVFGDWIAFRPNGMAIGSGGNSGAFSLCNASGSKFGRDIFISRTGSPAVADIEDEDCE